MAEFENITAKGLTFVVGEKIKSGEIVSIFITYLADDIFFLPIKCVLRNAFYVKEGYLTKGIHKQIAAWLVYSEYDRLANLGYTSAIKLEVKRDLRIANRRSKSTGGADDLGALQISNMVYKQGQYWDLKFNRLAIVPKPKL